jgi:hypothetical protein
MARDHGAAQRATCCLAEEASEDVEGQSAEVGEELPVVTQEHAQDLGAPATLYVAAALGKRPDELLVGQGEQQVLTEVLAHEEGTFLGAGITM